MRAGEARSTTTRVLLILGLLVPIISSLLILHDALNIPIGDEWWWVLLVYQDHTSGVHFADVWTQHNEHRIVFPTLLMLALERLGGYNVVREIGVNIVFALLTLMALVALIRRTVPLKAVPLFFALTSLLIFSMTQYENWIWGFQIAWFLVNLCAVIVVLLLSLYQTSLVALVLATGCAVIASFSVSSGLNLWIAGAFVIVCTAPLRWSRVVIWGLCSVICFAVYLHGYVKPAYHPSTTAFAGDPLGFVQYILTYLGAPLAAARRPLGVIPAGIVVTALFLTVTVLAARLKSSDLARRNAVLPWLGLAVFSGLSAVMTAIGRFGFGVDQAFSSRYVTVSSMFWIGALGAGFVLTRSYDRLRTLPYFRVAGITAVVIFVGSYALANRTALSLERGDKDHRLQAYAALQNIDSADDASLSYAFPDVHAIRSWTKLLEQVHEGPFR